MENISECRAVRLNWDKVCSIVSEEIEEILGLRIQYRINVVASRSEERRVGKEC